MQRLLRKPSPRIEGANCSEKVCLFVPMSFLANRWKLLVLKWRPRRDCFKPLSRAAEEVIRLLYRVRGIERYLIPKSYPFSTEV